MSTAKFEKLIDLIINEDQERAEQLFHEIVVEKSREIYESLMSEDMTSDLLDEVSVEEEGMEGMMEADDEFTTDEEEEGDYDVDADAMDADEEDMDVELDDMDADEEEMEADGDLEDRVVDLEDKLDELMAEFEAKMGAADEAEGEEEEAEGEEEEAEGEEEESSAMMEATEMQKVAPPKHGDNGANAKSPVAANAGGKGVVGSSVKPVMSHSGDEKGRSAPAAKDVAGAASFKNVPAKSGMKLETAPKAKHGDDGVNTKSPVAESKKALKRKV